MNETYPKITEECPDCKGTGRCWPSGSISTTDCPCCEGTGEILTDFGIHLRKSLKAMGVVFQD